VSDVEAMENLDVKKVNMPKAAPAPAPKAEAAPAAK